MRAALGKNRTCMVGRRAVLLLLELPIPRTILFELQVDTLSPFYGHSENRELQVHFLQGGWFCNLFFWVKVIPLVNSKVCFDSATHLQT